MAKLESLLTRVIDELPTVPKSLALRALSDSTKEFCTRTHAWRAELKATARAGSASVELLPDQGTIIVAVKAVRRAGTRLPIVPVELLDTRTTLPGEGPALAFAQVSPGHLLMDHAPTERTELTVSAAVTLALNSTTTDIPDALIDEYGEAIANGAKMRLVRQVNQPWTDQQLSAMYAVQYYTQVTAAKGRTFDTLGAADVTVQAPRW